VALWLILESDLVKEMPVALHIKSYVPALLIDFSCNKAVVGLQ